METKRKYGRMVVFFSQPPILPRSCAHLLLCLFLSPLHCIRWGASAASAAPFHFASTIPNNNRSYSSLFSSLSVYLHVHCFLNIRVQWKWYENKKKNRIETKPSVFIFSVIFSLSLYMYIGSLLVAHRRVFLHFSFFCGCCWLARYTALHKRCHSAVVVALFHRLLFISFTRMCNCVYMYVVCTHTNDAELTNKIDRLRSDLNSAHVDMCVLKRIGWVFRIKRKHT